MPVYSQASFIRYHAAAAAVDANIAISPCMALNSHGVRLVRCARDR